MATPWLTSNDIIESVKRKISFPLSQNTFTENDLLAFANEEMAISQVPTLLQYHEEFLVYNVSTSLVSNQSRYDIPDRAIGMRLRSVFYVDVSGNKFEMARVSNEEQAYYQRNVATNTALQKYYIEGNDLVLIPDMGANPTGSLQLSFFLRPNQLVTNDRAQICLNFQQTVTINNASLVAGNTLSINDTLLTAVASGATGLQFNVGGSSILTATNIVATINANLSTLEITTADNASGASNIITLTYSDRKIEFIPSNTSAFVVPTTLGIATNYTNSSGTVVVDINTIFTSTSILDLLQTKPGHKIQNYDVSIPTGGISGNIFILDEDDIPNSFSVGDYICLQNECIIPQIPPELHSALAERTCARILAAIGDQAGLQASQGKIQENNLAQNQLLDNRVEGNPIKVTNRYSLLRLGRLGNRRGF